MLSGDFVAQDRVGRDGAVSIEDSSVGNAVEVADGLRLIAEPLALVHQRRRGTVGGAGET